jgi:hypothetical protein
VPATAAPLWNRDAGGRLTACTKVADLLCVAQVDRHRVLGLDANDGELRWSFTAGGRVNSPPTIHAGRVLFGSTDGWLYCLHASRGQLAWRRRIAPQARRVVSHDQLESVWPLDGSILVREGIAYAAAGRSSYLDGGIRLVACSIATGDLIGELEPVVQGSELSGRQRGSSRFLEYGDERPFGRRDLLASDGASICMGRTRYLLPGSPEPPIVSPGQRAFSVSGMLDGNMFQRVGWSIAPDTVPGNQFGAELLVFDAQRAYAASRLGKTAHKPPPLVPGKGGFPITAFPRTLDNGSGGKRGRGPVAPHWVTEVPIWCRAMVATDGKLFVAGPPDEVDAADPWAAVDGRRGGRIVALRSATGEILAVSSLPAPPVYDGLIAAGGNLYVATVDGEVTCLGAKTP